MLKLDRIDTIAPSYELAMGPYVLKFARDEDDLVVLIAGRYDYHRSDSVASTSQDTVRVHIRSSEHDYDEE